MQVQQIRCVDIRPDPTSSGYTMPAIEPLADDIRSRGVLRPVLLRETTEGYVIVHGERRWRAASLAGLEAIPALVVEEPKRREAVAA